MAEDGQRSAPGNTNDACNGRSDLGSAGLPSGGTAFAGDELEPNRELEPGRPPLSGSSRREASVEPEVAYRIFQQVQVSREDVSPIDGTPRHRADKASSFPRYGEGQLAFFRPRVAATWNQGPALHSVVGALGRPSQAGLGRARGVRAPSVGQGGRRAGGSIRHPTLRFPQGVWESAVAPGPRAPAIEHDLVKHRVGKATPSGSVT